jgi:hypothetical protein
VGRDDHLYRHMGHLCCLDRRGGGVDHEGCRSHPPSLGVCCDVCVLTHHHLGLILHRGVYRGGDGVGGRGREELLEVLEEVEEDLSESRGVGVDLHLVEEVGEEHHLDRDEDLCDPMVEEGHDGYHDRHQRGRLEGSARNPC